MYGERVSAAKLQKTVIVANKSLFQHFLSGQLIFANYLIAL